MHPSQVVSVDASEMLSLCASVVSVAIGLLAIRLSIKFYQMSTETVARVQSAAEQINAGVARLDVVFNKLYQDTFTLMRDTHDDMRRKVFSPDPHPIVTEIDARAEPKLESLQSALKDEVAALLQKQESTDARVSSLQQLVAKAVRESRTIEAVAHETIRDRVIRALNSLLMVNVRVTTAMLVTALAGVASDYDVTTELFKMRNEGIVTWPRDGQNLGWEDELKMLKPT